MSNLTDVATKVAQRCGIRLAPARLTEAIEALSREPPEAGGSDASGPALVARLIDALTVKESYFLRQPAPLRALDWPQMLAQAVADGRDRVRVWSAGCANGEEPYTLALLCAEAFEAEPPPVDVLGTDVAAGALEQAGAGVYGERAMRQLGDELRERYFEAGDSEWSVGARLRELVRFEQHNLAQGAMPPADEEPFDLVVCRNVLIYFEPDAVARFARALPRALAKDARLVLGSADRLCLTQQSLRALRPFLEKAAAPPQPSGGGEQPSRRDRSSGRGGARASRRKIRREHRTIRRAVRKNRQESRPPRAVNDAAVAGALRLADAGKIEDATKTAASIVEEDPVNAPAQFVLGTLQLASGQIDAAVRALRAALYADPGFAAAAFQLGRAYDLLGEDVPARRAYRQALERVEAMPPRYPWLTEDIDAADLAVACAARLTRR